MEICEEGGLPGCRTGQPEQRLSSVGPQDRPARKEGSPQRRQGADRTLPEAPLKLPHQIVQEADKPQRGLGPRAKHREQNPSAPKAYWSSLMRFSMSARPL